MWWAGQGNLFAYVNDDPANKWDLDGLWGVAFGGDLSFLLGGGLSWGFGGTADLSGGPDFGYNGVMAGGGIASVVNAGGNLGVYFDSPERWAKSDAWHVGLPIPGFPVSGDLKFDACGITGVSFGMGFGLDASIAILSGETKLTPAP